MPKMPCRRFTLLDAMILVGASAVVMLGVRHLLWDSPYEDLASLVVHGSYIVWPEWLSTGHRIAGLVLMVASITLVLLRVRGPRPRFRRVMRQPGMVASFFVTAFSLISYVAWHLIECGERIVGNPPMMILLNIPTLMDEAPSASALFWYYLTPKDDSAIPCLVATAWLALWLGRVGRPEPGWIDRSGRVVGGLWIVWGIVGAFH